MTIGRSEIKSCSESPIRSHQSFTHIHLEEEKARVWGKICQALKKTIKIQKKNVKVDPGMSSKCEGWFLDKKDELAQRVPSGGRASA